MRVLRGAVMAAVGMALMAGATASPASAADNVAKKRQETARRMQDFVGYLDDNQSAPDRAIPQDLLNDCRGIMIYRQFKAGFGLGGSGGGGVAVLRRPDGSWSPPAFFQEGGASIGFQIGGQKVEAIFLIMNDDGVHMLLKTRFTIGVDASAAAGPVGRDAAAKVGPGTALLSYSRAKGLFAGAKIEGGVMVANDEANAALYGPGAGLSGILTNPATPMPPEAMPLINALNRYAPPRARAPAADPSRPTPAPATPVAPSPTAYRDTIPTVHATPAPAPQPSPAPVPPAPVPAPPPSPVPPAPQPQPPAVPPGNAPITHPLNQQPPAIR